MTQIYGILGHPVEHSLSPAMHNAAFKAEGIDAEYKRFDIDPENPDGLANFCYETDVNKMTGFSVTMPYKEAIMQYLDNIEVLAKQVSSVNTVKNEDSNLQGFNTDATGAIKALQEKAEIKSKKALVLGAGGGARAIIYALREYGAEVYIFNRTAQKAEALAEKFEVETIEFRDIKGAEFDIIVNCTPMQTISGERMLLHQATGQFEIWFDKPAPFDVMERALYKALEARGV